jgi:hypothetical protein
VETLKTNCHILDGINNTRETKNQKELKQNKISDVLAKNGSKASCLKCIHIHCSIHGTHVYNVNINIIFIQKDNLPLLELHYWCTCITTSGYQCNIGCSMCVHLFFPSVMIAVVQTKELTESWFLQYKAWNVKTKYLKEHFHIFFYTNFCRQIFSSLLVNITIKLL